MATDGAVLPNTGLATIKQEILDTNSTYGSPHAALSPTGQFSPTCYIGQESAGKLTELFQRVEEREAALRQCWAALEQTLIDYKQELRIISEISIHRENDGHSFCDATERTSDPTTKNDDGASSGNGEVAEDVTDKNECNDDSDEDSVNCLVMRHPDKGGKIRMLMKRIKRHDNRMLKEQYCLLKIQSDDDYDKFQHQMKEKELSLMSKVCQLGLVEAKLVEAEKRNMLSSYQLTKLVGHANKLSRLNERIRPGPARILPSEQLPASVSNLNNENRTTASHIETPDELRDSVMNANPFQPLLAEEVTGLPEAALVDEASSSLGSPLDAASPTPGAQFTPTLPRRRGRPPGPGRGGRVPVTVSMMVRGLATRRRRRGGRVPGQARPRYISEMIAANQGTAGSSSGPSQRARSTNIPIRTLLHMNALGLDISSSYQDHVDNHLSDSQGTLPGAQTQTQTQIPETVTEFGEQHSETSNGVKREHEHEQAEDTTDPFSGLYIDPSQIKTEPVDQNESEEQNESESVEDMDTTMGSRNTRRSSRASKRKFEAADDQS